MKAAILKELGSTPVFGEFKEPTIQSEDDLIMQVKAVALKNIDKLITTPDHYAGYKTVPQVVGLDGVGILEDGTRVYAKGKTGSMAEKMLISKNAYTPLSDQIGWSEAAAVPNAALGSYLPLLSKARLQKGEVVLINGGTGITGQMAIQLAKVYGASKVIVMGRVSGKEVHLMRLGADDTLSTEQEDSAILEKLERINSTYPIDIVLDYLWGHPLDLILETLAGKGKFLAGDKTTRIVNMGSLSGDQITFSSNRLRNSKTAILGSGLGSYSDEEFQHFNKDILPQIFQLVEEGRVQVEIDERKLEEIKTVWHLPFKGKRVVVKINS